MWEASRWTGVCSVCAIVLVGCGENDGSTGNDGGAGGNESRARGGSTVASGGSASASGGSASASGGTTNASGGAANASGGGTATGGGGAGGSSSGGSSSTGGNAGSSGGASSATCAPVTQSISYFDTIYDLPRCELGLESGVTNPAKADVNDIPLAAPLPAGVMHAVNLSPAHDTTPGNAEIWGANTACGPVTELLWFGPMLGGKQCAEFTPTEDVSRLMIVTRELEPLHGSFDYAIGDVTVCSKGMCPDGKNGQGRTPGATLVSPPGAYEYDSGKSWFGGEQFNVGTWGWMLAVYASDYTQDNGRLSAVAFRMPPTDPYGDTWYVGGAGSTMLEASSSSNYYVDARALQRLPSCATLGGAGTATFKWSSSTTGTANGTSTSSVTDLAGTALHVDGSCAGTRCSIRSIDEGTNHSTHLFIAVDGDLGSLGAPTGKPAKVVEATWFSLSDRGASPSVTCSTGGSVTYTPAGESVVTLNALGNLVPATGTAATPDSVRIALDWH